jgi:hypothetical protein
MSRHCRHISESVHLKALAIPASALEVDDEGPQAHPRDGRGALPQPLPRPALAKGETSGNTLAVEEIREDWDVDATRAHAAWGLTRPYAASTLGAPMPSRTVFAYVDATTVDVSTCGSGIELLLILPL